MEGRTIFMAKKKENVTEEIKVQESTVKAPVKKAAAKKVKESETKTQSDADIENEEALKAQELADNGTVVWKDNNDTVAKSDGTEVTEEIKEPDSVEDSKDKKNEGNKSSSDKKHGRTI